MPNTGTRYRRRRTTVPKGGPIKLGYFNSWITGTSGGVPFARWGTDQNPVGFHTYQFPFLKKEITIDSVHRGPPYLSGGPFKSLKITCSDPYGGVYGVGTYYRLDDKQRYVGGFRAPENSQFGADVVFDNLDLLEDSLHFPSMDGWGDKAWSRTKPQLEKAGGAVFARELRDLPRMLKTTAKGMHETWQSLGGNQTARAMQPRKTADHFLNIQFGWKPFLSDLKKFDNVIRNRAKIIANLSRKNGHYNRSRVTLKDETTNTILGTGSGVFLYPNSTFNQTGSTKWFPVANPATWERSEEVQSLVTAVGKFRFYRPEFDLSSPDYSSAWNSAMRNLTIAGFRVSPSNIYKATPWSWAIDWFSNVGDHVDHLNDILVDSVACKYLYVMQHKIRRQKFKQILPFKGGTVSLEFSRVIESKERQEAAGPHGFNLTWDAMTPRQMAIAVALGISRKAPLTGGP